MPDSPIRFQHTLRQVLYGMAIHDQARALQRSRGSLEHLFVLISFGDLLGVPILPPYYSMRLLPFVVPLIGNWKRQMLRVRMAGGRDGTLQQEGEWGLFRLLEAGALQGDPGARQLHLDPAVGEEQLLQGVPPKIGPAVGEGVGDDRIQLEQKAIARRAHNGKMIFPAQLASGGKFLEREMTLHLSKDPLQVFNLKLCDAGSRQVSR